MPEDALIAVAMRNSFYRDGQRKVMIILLLSILCNFVIWKTLILEISCIYREGLFRLILNIDKITALEMLPKFKIHLD